MEIIPDLSVLMAITTAGEILDSILLSLPQTVNALRNFEGTIITDSAIGGHVQRTSGTRGRLVVVGNPHEALQQAADLDEPLMVIGRSLVNSFLLNTATRRLSVVVVYGENATVPILPEMEGWHSISSGGIFREGRHSVSFHEYVRPGGH